jgi:hypothetical protein
VKLEWQEWQNRLVEERRQARQAADVFVRVCREGDADRLYDAHLLLNQCVDDAWRLAMAKVAKLPHVTPEIQRAFIPIWVESKMLPLRIGQRSITAAALRVLMPGNHSGLPRTLYRGTNIHERRRRLYGFSWTVDLGTARLFAKHWSQPIPANVGAYQGVECRLVRIIRTSPAMCSLERRPPACWERSAPADCDCACLAKSV